MGFRATSSNNGQATPYIYSSYGECMARINSIAAGMKRLKLLTERNDEGMLLLGIYMKNCTEWILGEHAAYALGATTVPFYDTLGPDTVHFILAQTHLRSVLCTRAQLSALVKAKGEDTPHFHNVIVIDGVTPEAAHLAQEAHLNLISLAKVEAVGAHVISTQPDSQDAKQSPPQGADIATFCYTSGTTGNPKGALITHKNLVTAMAGVTSTGIKAMLTDRHLSYLPLPHIFERVVINQMFTNGASVAFYRGDPSFLIEDMVACRPTLLPVAPRVLNKIYDKIIAGMDAAGGLKRRLFYAALKAKTAGLARGELKHGLYDRLLFNKIKAALGMDHLRFMVSGSAPLASNVMTFFRCLLGVPVVEGYGQTEGTASATISNSLDVTSVGHVGGPVDCCEIVLMDVPEMGYLSTDRVHSDGQPCFGRGEICVRGPNIFCGYYKEPEKTKETMDEEGWLHSGDIGLWLPSGTLKIVDRKKNIFKLAQGEYVAVEKIENILIRSPLIGQCFVYGDSLQSCLVAIIVPDEDVVRKWAADVDISAKTVLELCQNEQLIGEVLMQVMSLSKESGLHGFETVRAIHLDPEPFSVENGLLTPTFKLKRKELRERFQREIDQLYATLPSAPSKL